MFCADVLSDMVSMMRVFGVPSAQGQAKTLQKQRRRSRMITEARQAVQQMRALSAVLPLLLSREDCRGVPL